MKKKPPFFILGCVRSGTTMVRDILRRHPNLECPEETHFFRWGDPFGTHRYKKIYLKSKILKKQQEMDGISRWDVGVIMKMSESRKQFANGYANLYLKRKGNPNARWFDKSPQNVYGILLLSASFPDSKFIYIHRNPLNVVSSLLEGKVMPVHSLEGAINYWVEAMQIINEYKTAWPDRVLEVAYERITTHPTEAFTDLLTFIGEDPELLGDPTSYVRLERNRYRKRLTSEQVALIKRCCEPFMSQYNYA